MGAPAQVQTGPMAARGRVRRAAAALALAAAPAATVALTGGEVAGVLARIAVNHNETPAS